LNVIVTKFKNMGYKRIFSYTILALCFATSVFFVHHNYSFYERPIAEVISIKIEDSTEMTDIHNNKDQLFTQQIVAKLKDGEEKGELIHLTNEYSSSGAYDQKYEVGNKLFVLIDDNTEESTVLTGSIKDVKRDTHVLMIVWIFIFTLLIVGKKQGLFPS
jgi:uncharacterized membrane protein